MNRRIFWKLMVRLFVIAAAALPWGANPALAGPGGGTYFANSPAGGDSGTALRKFVDSLPGLGAPGCSESSPPGTGSCNENNLGQYIPIATKVTNPDGTPVYGPKTATDGSPIPASDFYEIGIVQYTRKMHSDLPKATLLRGYVDLNPAFLNNSSAQSRAQYLGPLIIATRNVPVRVKVTNMLPTGDAGKLFIPVDTTLMGAGYGPIGLNGTPCDWTDPANNCNNFMYTQNRTAVHLHGGNSPWISDGTPHQWFTPAGESINGQPYGAPYNVGPNFHDVPDMPDPGPGSETLYWTNQQSARLMFYHDHAVGITRLNVYAGMAAGYLITDPQNEDPLIANGTIPGQDMVNAGHPEYKYGIPLIIEDKTFVPKNVAVQDAKWTDPHWGTYGDLWFPHVYETNQDPNSPDGANPFGRWDYGPWFWPPVPLDAAHSTLPEPSATPESFMDTPVVNGTAYPYLQVEPKVYRFRILNASNDRTLNLSIFYADPNDPSGKEVKMVPAGPNPNFPPNWPTDGRDGGVPDPTLAGPNMIQIGNESGFLPAPVVIPNQPINYEYNRRNIVVLNVSTHALLLGPAERADVIIDFSKVPTGSTLILYNDGPAPIPGFDPRYDYYTGDPDNTFQGGAPSTLRGYGPNTRTIMQFRVVGTPSAPFDTAPLESALPIAFKNSQPVPLVPESTFPVASGGNAPTDLYAKIQDYAMTYTPIGASYPTTIPFHTKAIQELWDPYGRMNATLGIELPFTNNNTQTTIPMGYAEPPTEIITDGQPQIWKITHNGVDTHPVHIHMMDVQLINRVGWDGAVRPPDPNEVSWKEVIRMNPLEDTIVALRPRAQVLPFTLPDSVRPIDPSRPADARINTFDFGDLTSIYNPSTTGTPSVAVATTVTNTPTVSTGGAVAGVGYDYGYEYVWHCHILGHEENDFMRPIVFTTSTTVPPDPTGLTAYAYNQTVPGAANYVTPYANPYLNQIVLQWTDGSQPPAVPSSFRIERSDNGGPYKTLTTMSFIPGYPPIYTDTALAPNTTYVYRVFAYNVVGDSNPVVSAPVTTDPTWSPATGLTVTSSKPSPHVVGTDVQFKAVGSGAPANVAYQYRFWLNSGNGDVMVQDYGVGSTWTLPASTPVGTYVIKVDVRTSSAVSTYDQRQVVNFAVVPTPIPPVTVATPVPGIYSAPPVMVTLTVSTNAPPATIYYTTDGTLPTTASTQYTGPIAVNTTTTINYFAVDVNGTAEAVHSDTWYIHSADMVSSVKINNGASVTNSLNVTLSLSAVDPAGVATMQFSNDGNIWSAEEPYLPTKAWTLATGSDGTRTVYVRFRDKSLPSGVLYPPVTAGITLDTTPPATSATPIPGEYANGPISVTLTANEPSTIYYTTDGTTPTTGSTVYTAPIPINNNPGQTTTIKYFALDTAGNAETVKSGAWTMHITDLAASIKINNDANWTPSPTVTLTLFATDPDGVSTMQFSNDGVNFSTEEPYATTKQWTLTPGEGLKTVYVRFRDASQGGGNLYDPISASILYGVKDGLLPNTAGYLGSAVKALQFANGMAVPTPLDLVHGDVAPYANGAARPDNKINLLDVYAIILHIVGLVTTY